MDCSPPGSSVHGILQARILEWVTMPSSRASYPLRDETASRVSPALAGGFFTTSASWEALIRGESLASKRQSIGWAWVGLRSLQGRHGSGSLG